MERIEIIEKLESGDTTVIAEAIKMLKEDEDIIMSLVNSVGSLKALYRGLDRELKRREKENGTK